MKLLIALTVLKILGYWNYSWWWIITPVIVYVFLSASLILGMKTCFFCRERILSKATKCKHCHSILTQDK